MEKQTTWLLQPTCREQVLARLGPASHAPVKDVVIFPTPAPVLVREAIDLQKLCLAQARDTSEVARVWQPAEDKQERWESVKPRMGSGAQNLGGPSYT